MVVGQDLTIGADDDARALTGTGLAAGLDGDHARQDCCRDLAHRAVSGGVGVTAGYCCAVERAHGRRGIIVVEGVRDQTTRAATDKTRGEYRRDHGGGYLAGPTLRGSPGGRPVAGRRRLKCETERRELFGLRTGLRGGQAGCRRLRRRCRGGLVAGAGVACHGSIRCRADSGCGNPARGTGWRTFGLGSIEDLSVVVGVSSAGIVHAFTVARHPEMTLRTAQEDDEKAQVLVAAGRRKVTWVPPVSARAASTAPPCRSATCLTIASPRPEPGNRRASVAR